MSDKNAVVLLSGGQDSTTCLFWAKKNFENVLALTIYYGQAHKIELFAARAIAGFANVLLEEVFLPQNALRGGTLLNSNIDTTHGKEIAPTFVPMRNALFLCIAANRAYILNYNSIVIGVSQVDFSGYPDCRGPFIESMESMVSLALEEHNIRIHTPLMYKSKAETIKLAQTLPNCMEALAFSYTCYKGDPTPCGECPACKLRAKGFEEVGIPDPAFGGYDGTVA